MRRSEHAKARARSLLVRAGRTTHLASLAISGCITLAFVSHVNASDFYINGTIRTDYGEPIPFSNFVILAIEKQKRQKVDFSGDTYEIPLDLDTFYDATLRFEFPFPAESPHFSFEDPPFRPSSRQLGEFDRVQQDFTFLRPTTYASLVLDKADQAMSSDDCDVFDDLARRMSAISALQLKTFLQPSALYTRMLKTSGLVLYKLVYHRCDFSKTINIREAIQRLVSDQSLKGLSVRERTSVGENISVAVNQIDYTDSNASSMFQFGETIISALRNGVADQDVDQKMADLIYAEVIFNRSIGASQESNRKMRSILFSGVLDSFTETKEEIVFLFFLNVSGGKLLNDVGEGAAYQYSKPRPSEDEFSEIVDPKDLVDWCFLKQTVDNDQALERRLSRLGRKATLQKELVALTASEVCHDEV